MGITGRSTARIGAWLVAMALGAASFAAAAATTAYTLVDIGTLGGAGSYGSAISDNGLVVGCAEVASGAIHAFVYRDGTLQDLGTGTAGEGNSCALAVNDSGTVAGRAANGELVVWKGGNITRLGVSGNVGGINKDGVVVGSYTDAGQTRAFQFSNGRLVPIAGTAPSTAHAINKRGEIVGSADGRAFLYRNGELRDLGTLGGNNSVARGINDRGVVVGMSSNTFGQPTPFIHDGAMRELPGGSYAAAIGVNDRLQIVASAEGRHGYLLVDGAITYLDSLPAVQAMGWRNLEPTGINDRGWIVGTGVNPQGDFRAFLLMPRQLAKPLRK